jgi:predicted TIM-barrel fold metal-dependent hydrolase
MSRTIIDAWVQVPNRGFLLDPMFDLMRNWSIHWRTLAQQGHGIPVSAVVATMREQGVTQMLASAWWGPRGPLITNEEVADAARRYPDFVAGIGAVDLSRPMDAVRELRRCVRDYGFKGVRLLPWLWGWPPDDRRYYPLYAECVELDVTCCVQVGHAGPAYPSEPGRPIPYLDHVAHDFPELRIVAGRIGFPWTSEMISLLMKYPNVYVDTSAYKTSRYPAELVEFMRGTGRSKVLFGSNYPMLTPEECLQDLDELGLDEQAEELFLAGNARSVFKLA